VRGTNPRGIDALSDRVWPSTASSQSAHPDDRMKGFPLRAVDPIRCFEALGW
jgi:hypothetical protein